MQDEVELGLEQGQISFWILN